MPEFLSPPLLLLLAALGGYLLGSIPFGMVLARVLGLGDLRQIGSGNIGATNVLRTGNKGAAAATLLLDAAKGAAAVLLARALIGPDAAQIAGLCAMLGHCYPVWLGFEGGKGMATFLGTLLALAWPLGLIACAVWLVTATLSRYSSLSALLSAATAPLVAVGLHQADFFLLLVLLMGLIYWRHRANISRLRARSEPKIGGS